MPMNAPSRSASASSAPTPAKATLDERIDLATEALFALQRPDGHWVFELEADATIPAEYVLLTHYLGEPDVALERKIAVYLRRVRTAQGGWPLFPEGTFNVSASVKAYLALKAIGDSPGAAHMREAREAILAHGGLVATNVFTRILLALFGMLPWTAVPTMPVEIVLLPKWFPFHLSRVSYWTRTVLVPLLVLGALKPRACNPRGVNANELLTEASAPLRACMRAPHQNRVKFAAFAAVDRALQALTPCVPSALRRRAIDKAVAFVLERRNGEDGLGGIFPAMAFAVMMFDALGYSRDDPVYQQARRAIDNLVVQRADEAYCQPCVSPIWDTVLACHALLEVGGEASTSRVRKGLAWLRRRQIVDTRGDWAEQRPDTPPGGWCFQYANAHYPDLDDTGAVVVALDRAVRHAVGLRDADNDYAIERARAWVLGMQSRNGGFGAFDADNTSEYLNDIPFADHGALIDPPTADVTARCIGMVAQLGNPQDRAAIDRGLAFLRRTQERDGSWYGRWGMNYVYGTWSVLCALNAAGVDLRAPEIRRAVDWLISIQNTDGGWGEGGESYDLGRQRHAAAPSTATQTSWALLALMSAGEVRHPAVQLGIEYLARTQDASGFWTEPLFNATGFPRVFYLRYHGYAKFFPLWALARYRNLQKSGETRVRFAL